MQDNLPELRDIHLPSGDISFFPLAYGWWVLAGVLAAAVLLAWLTRFLLQRSKKRYALKLLAAARRPDLGSAVRMSEILRRICGAFRHGMDRVPEPPRKRKNFRQNRPSAA